MNRNSRPDEVIILLRRWLALSMFLLFTGCGTPLMTVDEMVERSAALCDRGRGEEALQLLDQVTAKEEMFPRAFYLKGLAHEVNHELHFAKRAYDKCLEQAPDDSAALNNRGSVQLRLGRFSEAEADLIRATQLDPNDDLAWANLGITQQELGRTGDAISSLRRAVTLRKSVMHYLQLGHLLIENGDYAEAEKALSDSLELDPHNAGALLSRSHARARQGKTEEALQDLESARTADADMALYGPIRFAKLELLQR